MSLKFTLLFLIVSLCGGYNGFTQQMVSGKIFDAKSDSSVQDVLIINLNTQQTSYGNKEGKYSIAAAEGHRLVYTAIGYGADTIRVEFYMFITGYDISLKPRFSTLQTVVVSDRNYQLDSLERREEYRRLLDNKLPSITGRNTPQYGAGIVLSPGSYFSKKSRQERELKRKLIQDEEAEYVNFRFSRGLVQQYTGLKGDSLQTFMLRFRPDYEFCRKSNQEDMIHYINQKLKLYLQREEKN